MKEITVEASVENLDKVLEFIDQELEVLEVSMKTQSQIDIGIDEIFNNISSYAYKPEKGYVKIEFEEEKEPHAIYLSFIDSGVPYNPLLNEDPDITLSAEDRGIGGLGIFMVKKLFDEVSYQNVDGKNILKLKKVL